MKRDMRGIHIGRKLENPEQLKDLAFNLNVAAPRKPFHVTLAYSRRKVDWKAIRPHTSNMIIRPLNPRLERLGGGSVLAVVFGCYPLVDRWQELCDLGAAWDYPQYKPHISLGRYRRGIDLDQPLEIDPLIFGPEYRKEPK